jgi:hypothetical protein
MTRSHATGYLLKRTAEIIERSEAYDVARDPYTVHHYTLQVGLLATTTHLCSR